MILGSESNHVGDTGGQQKHKLIENEESVYNQNTKIEQAKRSAIEIEGMSLDVMRQLHQQSNQMKDINSQVVKINTGIDDSTVILNKMNYSQNRKKLFIFCALITIFLAVLVVAIVKFL